MPARILPPVNEIRRMRESGMTQQQIADDLHVSRGAIAALLSRARVVGAHKRYAETLPWVIKTEHAMHYHARMLRLLGRRLGGEDIPVDQAKRLDSWLAKLSDGGLVVVYVPDTEEGFHLVKGEPDSPGVPIKASL